MVYVVKLEPTSQWDQSLLNLLWDNELLPTGIDFKIVNHVDLVPTDGLILVIPGRYWCDETFGNKHPYDTINEMIARFKWVLAIRTGDEEDSFKIDRIQHPNIRWWVQTPRVDRDYGNARVFGVGFTEHFTQLDRMCPDKNIDVYLAGQNTHERRKQAFDAATYLQVNKLLHESAGFTQGLPQDEYTRYMCESKIALAPSGPQSPDSFRLYEALEAHCIPIADDITPAYNSEGYWRTIFGDPPFPIITDYAELPNLVRDALSKWVPWSNRIAAWWMREKRRYVTWLREDLHALSGVLVRDIGKDAITVVVPVSPIPSHPNTTILGQTIASIRHWLPNSEIMLTFDGVRPEQEHMREAYEEHIRRVLWYADRSWGNITPYVFDEHLHQSGMLREVIDDIHTPLMLFVEQDTPLVVDEDIPWDAIMERILSCDSDLIRFHHETHILQVHKHLMYERDGDFVRTAQWSQRPHIARTDFYRHLLETYFSPEAKCFIEERLAGVFESDWCRGILHMYAPEIDNIRRSYHLNGRAGGPQYTESQVF